MLRTLKEYSSLLCFIVKKSFGLASDPEKIPVFVVGLQRSGTTMILRTFEHSSECRVYQEWNQLAYKRAHRLRHDIKIKHLIEKSDKKIVVFKPLNDTQNADRFFYLQKNTKVIWVYRNYYDVANSAKKKWGTIHKNIMTSLCKGSLEHPRHHTYKERITPETLEQVKIVFKEDMSDEDGAALLWYVRNSIYFDLNLDKEDRVLLVKYEDLVTDPIQHFKTIFDFILCPFTEEYVKDIHNSSIKREHQPVFDSKVKCLCDEMTNRLNNQYVS